MKLEADGAIGLRGGLAEGFLEPIVVLRLEGAFEDGGGDGSAF